MGDDAEVVRDQQHRCAEVVLQFLDHLASLSAVYLAGSRVQVVDEGLQGCVVTLIVFTKDRALGGYAWIGNGGQRET